MMWTACSRRGGKAKGPLSTRTPPSGCTRENGYPTTNHGARTARRYPPIQLIPSPGRYTFRFVREIVPLFIIPPIEAMATRDSNVPPVMHREHPPK